MKKFIMCAAAVAMLGLASCSGNKAEATDSLAADTQAVDTMVMQETAVAIDSIAPDSAQITVAQETVEAAVPAAEAAQN